MSDRIQQHITALTDARTHLDSALDRIGDRGDEQLYSDGAQWTLRDLAIHLMVADKGHNRMLMTIAQGEELIPEDYDLERFNKRSVEKNAQITLEQARAALAASRAELLEWLNTIDDATLDKRGRHASLQIMSLSQIMDLMAHHERGHADDIIAHLERDS